MTKLIEWGKSHKVILLLGLIVLFLLFRDASPIPLSIGSRSWANRFGQPEIALPAAEMAVGMGGPSLGKVMSPLPPYGRDIAPTTISDRMVTKDTSLSLKVDDVAKMIADIESKSKEFGGYLIDSNLSVPEGASSGQISVRVPADKRAEALSAIKLLGIKVVSEYVVGQDVTDQYVDNGERLRILESTKSKFETILAEAKTVNDMLNVQQQLLSLQQQIDTIRGQQKFLEGSTSLSRITIYLSTDELALPYAPDTSWRPGVVFKEAVRSLILNVREAGTVLIWIAVYTPVWLVVLLIGYAIYRKRLAVK